MGNVIQTARFPVQTANEREKWRRHFSRVNISAWKRTQLPALRESESAKERRLTWGRCYH